MKSKVSISLMIILCACISATAQVATGGNFTLDQSVIAGGGGQGSTGGTFSVDGTIGQSIAGTNSTNPPFGVRSGFWVDAPLAPTAASVAVSGRVLTDGGNGLTNARVVLTSASGVNRTVTTSSFGYFRFDDVAAGETYIFTVVSRRYQFAPQIVFVGNELTGLDFTALTIGRTLPPER